MSLVPKNRTRRLPKIARRNSPKNRPVVEKVREKCWAEETYERFLQEGAELFTCLKNNFKDVFENEDTLVLFDITDKRRCYYYKEIEKIKDKYFNDIQKELIVWIHNEHASGSLFLESNWKPFRDLDIMTTMFFGYKRMFKYKQYYFQLIMDGYIDDCEGNDKRVLFELNLYGWMDDTHEKLQPDDMAIIPPDAMMPSWYWNVE